MAMEYRKTTSLVRLNSKMEAVNLLHVDFTGTATIEEGRFIVEDANGRGRKAVAGALGTGDHYVWISFLDTTHGSVKDSTGNVFDESAPTIVQGSGGLSGIVGNGVPIGIHKKYWDLVGSPVIGDAVIIGTDAKPSNIPLFGGGAIASNVPYFGVIYRIVDDIIWFVFESAGRVTGLP